ncbi:MAG: redox-regulated ATPase YchF [Dehalococcoidales bacterium]
MSISIGIIGLPQSGKTTVFNALTGGKADTASHAAGGVSQHIGVAHIPEPRLKVLADLLHPTKVVFAEAKFIDIGASVKNLAKDKGIGGQLLNQLSAVDSLICVVRVFKDESIPHPQGSLDIKRDIEALNLELSFADLSIIERRLEKLEESMKAAKPGERQGFLQEKDILLGFKAELEKDKALRTLSMDTTATRLVTNYQFLTAKPMLIVVNIDEDQLAQAATLEAELNTQFADAKCRVVTLCGKLEMELAQLEEKAAQEFRREYGLKESGLERTVKMSYELADMMTFFSSASNEVRAWSIKKGTPAQKAAGKIHTDMEKGFIRAECISFDELVKCGSFAEAKKKGLLRLEGKEYVIQDGDVVTFLFNV